jgi:hypothetical protein
MLIKVKTDIILDVKDDDEAEQACMAIESLDRIMSQNSFPHGEVIATDVDHYEKVSDEEAEEQGWVEEE